MADTVASLCCQGQNTPLTWVTLFQRTFVVLPDSVLLAMDKLVNYPIDMGDIISKNV